MPKKMHITFMLTVVMAIVTLASGCTTKGVFPGKQCISLFESDTESISAEIITDSDGCIIDEKEKPIKFYRSTDCSGEPEPEENIKREGPEKGFIFASSTRGGCPQLVEVSTKSPACVTLTLQSGRKVIFCY